MTRVVSVSSSLTPSMFRIAGSPGPNRPSSGIPGYVPEIIDQVPAKSWLPEGADRWAVVLQSLKVIVFPTKLSTSGGWVSFGPMGLTNIRSPVFLSRIQQPFFPWLAAISSTSFRDRGDTGGQVLLSTVVTCAQSASEETRKARMLGTTALSFPLQQSDDLWFAKCTLSIRLRQVVFLIGKVETVGLLVERFCCAYVYQKISLGSGCLQCFVQCVGLFCLSQRRLRKTLIVRMAFRELLPSASTIRKVRLTSHHKPKHIQAISISRDGSPVALLDGEVGITIRLTF